MESSNRNNDFQTQLKQLNFKSFYHNQMETFGYDDLFASKRVVIFSITYSSSVESTTQLTAFNRLYDNFCNNGVDDVYAINSNSLLFGPRVDKLSKKIKGLLDAEGHFVSALGNLYYPDCTAFDLARYWQYVICLNDGVPEKIWNNVYKPSLPLRILKSPGYQYRKIGPELVLEYFKNSVDTKQ